METISSSELQLWVNNAWMLITAFLVFVMHLGFAALEVGSTRSKNTVDILFENIDSHEHGADAYLIPAIMDVAAK